MVNTRVTVASCSRGPRALTGAHLVAVEHRGLGTVNMTAASCSKGREPFPLLIWRRGSTGGRGPRAFTATHLTQRAPRLWSRKKQSPRIMQPHYRSGILPPACTRPRGIRGGTEESRAPSQPLFSRLEQIPPLPLPRHDAPL